MLAESSPYVGPRPFENADRDKFFGRNQEINELVPLIYAHRILVLYAQSGTGKTSLLEAALTPAIEEEGFDVYRATRVSGLASTDVEANQATNIYVFNAISGWLSDDAVSSPEQTLSGFLAASDHRLGEDDEPAFRLLIFDQFEELFTFYPDRWKERAAFFQQMREALDDDQSMRVVLSLREDFLAQLEPYLLGLRGVTLGKYHLEGLRERAALAAVVDPVRGTRRSFGNGVAENLVADLLQISVERGGESVQEVGEYVEPVQLQVVCKTLWEGLPPEAEVISGEHLKAFGDADEALVAFYESSLRDALRSGRVREKDLRNWFEHSLITKAGTRGTVYQEQDATNGVPTPVVKALEDAHVIRGETQRGARWLELTHDRFIEPIRTANQAFRRKRRKKLLRRAIVAGIIFGALGVSAIVSNLGRSDVVIVVIEISIDEIVDGSVGPGQKEAFVFTLSSPLALSVEADAEEPEAVLTMTISSPDVEELEGSSRSSTGSAAIEATLVPGTYEVELASTVPTAFELQVRTESACEKFNEDPFGSFGTGALDEQNPVQIWCFPVADPEVVSLNLDSNREVLVEVFGPDGTRHAIGSTTAPIGSFGSAFFFESLLADEGIYVVSVKPLADDRTIEYSVFLERSGVGVVEHDVPLVRTIEAFIPDYLTFDGGPFQLATVRLAADSPLPPPSEFFGDPLYVDLSGPGHGAFASVAGRSTADMEFLLPTFGDWIISFTYQPPEEEGEFFPEEGEFFPEEGEFFSSAPLELSIVVSVDPIAPMALPGGQLVTGTIDDFELDVWSFDVDAGEDFSVSFRVPESSFIFPEVFDPNGRVLTPDFDEETDFFTLPERLDFKATVGGTYILTIGNYSGAFGWEYELKLENQEAE